MSKSSLQNNKYRPVPCGYSRIWLCGMHLYTQRTLDVRDLHPKMGWQIPFMGAELCKTYRKEKIGEIWFVGGTRQSYKHKLNMDDTHPHTHTVKSKLSWIGNTGR